MIREVIATGRDVNAAIDSGCVELGIDRENAEFEIISLPKKGFLGLKVYPAKVRIYQELPDPVVKPAPRPAPPKAAQQPAPRPQEAPPKRPAPDTMTRPAPRPAEAAEPHQHAPAPKPQRREEPRRGEPRPALEQPAFEENYEPTPQVEVEPTPEVREKVEKAAAYLADIMRTIGFETIEVTPAYYTESVCLRLSGAQLGVVIGRRGETLDALQYLTSLVANRGEGDYIRINIDSGNYREKREKTLTALARKLALQAVRTGKSTTLEPMNPYERRVIHGAVSQIRGAVSTSIGADPNRRVVISIADPAKRTGEAPLERGDHTGRGGRGDRRGRDSRDNRDRGSRPPKSSTPLVPNTNKPFTPGTAGAPRREPTPLRPNTNTVASVAAAAIVVRRLEESDGPTAIFAASRPAVTNAPPPAPQHPSSGATPPQCPGSSATPPPAPQCPSSGATPPSSGKRLSDAELFGDIPMGVPILSGDRPAAPKPAYEPKPKPIPKKLDGELYGKIE